MMSTDQWFLGLDSSTQGLKATVIDGDANVVKTLGLNFSKDLPEFGTTDGYIKGEGDEVTAPSLMFVAALDKLLGSLKADGFDFSKVRSVSGSGQQHGSCYWKAGAEGTLGGLKAGAPLAAQLADAFTVANGPIWMDSSTGAQCAALTDKLGGAQAVADLTGSRAYERFTGNQIAKIAVENKAAYDATERVSLVSSMMPSVLLGKYAGIDHSDAGGMNLMDLRAKVWSSAALDATAPGLEAKLGPLTASHSTLGTISPYFVAEYGFGADCTVVAWSGDNPNSVAGLGLRPGDVAISMGTSDTLFGITATPQPATEGHVFVNPVDPESFMVMLCYKNGSLNRERIKSALCPGGSWEEFNALLAKSQPGNGGNVGLYVAEAEITPPLPKGDFRFSGSVEAVEVFPPEVEARALVEGRALSMRLHASEIGIVAERIVATGGASANTELLQVISDVFGLPVYTADSTDSASLGAALRALQGYKSELAGKCVPFTEVYAGNVSLSAEPKVDTQIYTDLLAKFKEAEAKVLA